MKHPILLAALLCTTSARAQVNAEILRPNPLRPGVSATLDASLAAVRGNVELHDVGGALRLQHQTLHPAEKGAVPFVFQRAFLSASGRYADRAGTAFVSQSFLHARWTAMWHPRVGSDVFVQHQTNQFLRLQARLVGGGGVRLELVHGPAVMAWAGSGLMLEYDRIVVAPLASDAPARWEVRSTSYFTVRVSTLDGRLLLQNTVYAQPRVGRARDVRLLEELEVLARVTDVFALGTTLGWVHDTAPPTGVKPTDGRVLSMVRLSF
ncbi:MAG: DUF481 domain-containing protein [Myxococcales bacterium]|nr:DUF481 domain-containing protein [Myxococcales bacterium]